MTDKSQRLSKANELDRHRAIQKDIEDRLKHYQGVIDSLWDYDLNSLSPENQKTLDEAKAHLEKLLADAPELFKEQSLIENKLVKELTEGIPKQITKPKTGTTAHSRKKHKIFEKKVAKMKKLYRQYKEKGYKEKQCYELISKNHYPEHSPSTVDTYINKK